MRTCVDICSHCGKEYMWQASGDWALETPKQYNSDKYCPDCKKTLDDALNSITILFENKRVEVSELLEFDPSLINVTPEYIFKLIEEREAEFINRNSNESLLPIARRVYANLWNTETNEYSVSGEVCDKINKNYRDINRSFSYFYWPSKPDEIKISVNVRIDKTTNKVVDYARFNHYGKS